MLWLQKGRITCELKPCEKTLKLEEGTQSLNPYISRSQTSALRKPIKQAESLGIFRKIFLTGYFLTKIFPDQKCLTPSLVASPGNYVLKRWWWWIRDGHEGLCRNRKEQEGKAYLNWNARGNLRKAQPRLGSTTFGNPAKAVRSQKKGKTDIQQSVTYQTLDQQFNQPWHTDHLSLLPPGLGPYLRGTKM